jgi:3-hydroxyisobutyrate dehydrogenase
MRVGFVGLGNLGLPITLSLLRGGWSVSAYDHVADRVDACARAGATPVPSLADLADCALVAVALPDDDGVAEVVTGDGGLLTALSPGSAVVVHSTVLPTTAQFLHQAGAACDVSVLDAPVSGGPARAGEGDLAVMVGGDDDVVARAHSFLHAVGSHVWHLGPAGAGAAAKLANQLMMFSTLAGAYEAVDLAASYGVPEEHVLEVARESLSDSWVARNLGFFGEMADAYDEAGTPVRERSWSKDLWDVVATARAADLRLPVAGLLAQHVADVVENRARPPRP